MLLHISRIDPRLKRLQQVGTSAAFAIKKDEEDQVGDLTSVLATSYLWHLHG